MKTEVLPASHPGAIRHAADVLRYGGLVAFPTDTVYGVGAPAFDEVTVSRLYTIKGRSTDKAIAVLLASADDLPRVTAGLNPMAQRLARAFWPGPLTLVVARHPDLPQEVSHDQTVGVRVPDHPTALALLAATGPLAVTSANRSGEKNPLSAADVLAGLRNRFDLLLDGGRTPGGAPSTVVDCLGSAPRILRSGPISEEQLLAALAPERNNRGPADAHRN
ncbi:MAG: threonylcarbamoyl-AMP synthase [Chloroflexi bacterium]|nr:threonylcarbamoyl-AMP synthase [Chloroflexota bacterium]